MPSSNKISLSLSQLERERPRSFPRLPDDWHLYNLLIKSSWAAIKDAGLPPRVAVDLVSRNIERILEVVVHPNENDDDDDRKKVTLSSTRAIRWNMVLGLCLRLMGMGMMEVW